MLGIQYIGVMAALAVLVGAIISFMSPWINRCLGAKAKPYLLTVGALSFACTALPFLFQDPKDFTLAQLVCVYSVVSTSGASAVSSNLHLLVLILCRVHC